MAKSENSDLGKLIQILSRLETAEHAPSPSSPSPEPSEEPLAEPPIEHPDEEGHQSAKLTDRLEAVEKLFQTDPPPHPPSLSEKPYESAENASAKIASAGWAAESLSPIAKGPDTSESAPYRDKRMTKPIRRKANVTLVVVVVSIVTFLATGGALLFLLHHIGELPDDVMIALRLPGASTDSATTDSRTTDVASTKDTAILAPPEAKRTPATTSSDSDVLHARPTTPEWFDGRPSKSGTITARQLGLLNLGNRLTRDNRRFSVASPRRVAKHKLLVPPRLIIPPGAPLQVPFVLSNDKFADSQLLIGGLESSASIRGGIEVAPGTWLIDVNKLAKSLLVRGKDAPAHIPLSIELRSSSGEVIERHRAHLLTSNNVSFDVDQE